MRWFTPGLIFGALLIVVDVALRHPALSAMTAQEQRQYALSLVGCLLFWHGVGAVFSGLAQMRRWVRVACTSLVIMASVAVIIVPYWVWLNFGRFPNREMVVFLANEWSFVSRMGASYFGWRELLTALLALAGVLALSTATACAAPPKDGRWRSTSAGLPLLLLIIVRVSTFAPSHPLTPEHNTLRLLALLQQWGHQPPRFFSLRERLAARPEGDDATPLPFNLLFVVGETFGAQYLKSPSGTAITPKFLSVFEDPQVVPLRALHSNSTCTDISLPSLLSGLSPFSTVRDFQLASLPFDEAASRGALTFVASTHRLDWANLESFLGRAHFTHFKDARDFDPSIEPDADVPDAWTYGQALSFMREASSAGKRFAGLLHLNTLHGPYWPDPDDLPFTDEAGFPNFGGGFVRYLNAMARFDKQFGQFWDSFRAEPFFGETLVVMTADHGESFGQHGLYSHCNSFFPEETHVPGFIRVPQGAQSQLPALRASESRFTSNADLIPTVYAFLGWNEKPEWVGHSLLQPHSTSTVLSNCSEIRQCSSVDWGFVEEGLRWVYQGASNTWSAFDVESDPAGLRDVSDQHRAALAKGSARWRLNTEH